MKKIFTFLASMAMALGAQASGTCDVLGTVFTVDTLFHAYVGPGTTQTSLYFHTGTKEMRVFYSKIDLSNPYVSVKAVSGTDKFAGGETVSHMAKRKDAPGARYYIGVNGDFWVTGGQTARGESMVGAPISSCIADGFIYKAQNGREYQFTIDQNEVPSLGVVNFAGTLVNAAGTSVNVGGVNIDAVDNAVSLYNPKYFKGTNQFNCTEVQVKYVEGDSSFAWGKACRLEVIGAPSTAGDMDLPAQGLVLTARGTAQNFIAGLKPGDQVTLTLNASLNGNALFPSEIISGQPWVLKDGNVVNNGDPAVHPRTVLGYSEDGKTVIFLVVDGRSPISDGATTAQLGVMMKYAGAHQAVNVDGGGSTCMYSSALGIRNVPSDGTERADANGIFAVSNAPDDAQVADIKFLDWSLTLPKYGVYKPKFFGYNQYGMLVNTGLQGVTLSCPESIGLIKEDGTLFANGSGTAMLTATYLGHTATIPVTVMETNSDITLVNDSVINDCYRTYTIELQSTVLDKVMAVDPAALTWTSSDESIVTVGADTGVLQGVKDGVAYVYGQLGDVKDTLKVIVEKPKAHVMAIDPALDISTWKITQVGGTSPVATSSGNGIDYTYTGAAGRAPKIVLNKQLRLWSLPDTLRLRLNPGEAPVKNFVFSLRPSSGTLSYQTVTPDSVVANREMVIDLPTAAWIDTSDMSNYPIMLNSIQVNMNASTTGKVYNMKFLGFETVYNAVEGGMDGDVNGDGVVNVSDVTSLINMILGTSPVNLAVADLNNDMIVNVSDVTTLINMILGL